MKMEKEKAVLKIKKKKWIEIVAPKIFDERIIGETLVDEPSKLIGRPVLLNMMVLTGDPKKQNINVKFLIDSIKESRAMTKPIGYYLNSISLRRMMRRAAGRVDDSFALETADNVIVRIKPFLLTRQEVTGSVITSIRKITRNFIAKQVKKLTFEKLIFAIATTKFQRSVSAFIKKIYPLRTCEIRALYIEKKTKVSQKKIVVAQEEPENLPGEKEEVSEEAAAEKKEEQQEENPKKNKKESSNEEEISEE